MIHNDVLRSVRHMLNVSELTIATIIELGGLEVPLSEVAGYLLKEDEVGYRACPDAVMAHFLDGLIIYRRGRNETIAAKPIETQVTNNTVLKKLRVAFELKESDMLAIMQDAQLPVSKHELSALFRSPGHGNYRPCGDQFLRRFLRSLTNRVRG
ncbi:DUF1456 family protein [Sandaracinus amylolyticus]|uniref:DUF1456 family protein n=1 Tax=Sandaracinus amylolyticus TaxID=927083 RepID=UPI0022A72401|nr:DUF1456 family protein [Sandaracinus amylolyticus]UJR83214.1 Hypothetical protein I5071_52800 [Sandaracinus amylolyticus]